MNWFHYAFEQYHDDLDKLRKNELTSDVFNRLLGYWSYLMERKFKGVSYACNNRIKQNITQKQLDLKEAFQDATSTFTGKVMAGKFDYILEQEPYHPGAMVNATKLTLHRDMLGFLKLRKQKTKPAALEAGEGDGEQPLKSSQGQSSYIAKHQREVPLDTLTEAGKLVDELVETPENSLTDLLDQEKALTWNKALLQWAQVYPAVRAKLLKAKKNAPVLVLLVDWLHQLVKTGDFALPDFDRIAKEFQLKSQAVRHLWREVLKQVAQTYRSQGVVPMF